MNHWMGACVVTARFDTQPNGSFCWQSILTFMSSDCGAADMGVIYITKTQSQIHMAAYAPQQNRRLGQCIIFPKCFQITWKRASCEYRPRCLHLALQLNKRYHLKRSTLVLLVWHWLDRNEALIFIRQRSPHQSSPYTSLRIFILYEPSKLASCSNLPGADIA